MLPVYLLRRQRKPFLASVKLTYRCNLRCLQCPYYQMEGPELDFQQALALFDRLKERGSRIAILEGGEPMLWKDGAHSIYDLVREAKKRFVRVGMTTNGTLPLDAPVDVLWVSLDGLQATHDRLRAAPVFERVIANIRASRHPRLYAHITINSQNAAEIPELVAYLAGLVRGITVQFYYPYGGKDDAFPGFRAAGGAAGAAAGAQEARPAHPEFQRRLDRAQNQPLALRRLAGGQCQSRRLAAPGLLPGRAWAGQLRPVRLLPAHRGLAGPPGQPASHPGGAADFLFIRVGKMGAKIATLWKSRLRKFSLRFNDIVPDRDLRGCPGEFNTRWGAYLSDDTYYYILPAQELLAGRGFNPSYIFGPLFPLALAGLSLAGLDVLLAARWLNAVLFGVNLMLVGFITRRLNVPAGFAWLAAALVLLSDTVAEAHGWAMSEALGITFILLSLLLALEYFLKGERRYWWLMVVATGLALLARYASLPLVGAIAVTLFIFAPGRRWVARLANAAAFGALSLAPLALYFLRNQVVSGHPFRYLNLYVVPFTQDQITWFMYHWFSLFIPGRFLRGNEIGIGLVLLVAGAGLAAGLFLRYRNKWKDVCDRRSRSGLFVLASFIILNFMMLWLARGFTELDIFNARYLVPVLVVFLMLLCAAAGLVWKAAGRVADAALVIFFGMFLVYYGVRTADFSSKVYTTGLGYSNVGWHGSQTVEYIRAHPELSEMVSTGEMGIYFWTGRKPISLAEFPNAQELKTYICQRNGAVFLMDQMPPEIYGMTQEEVDRVLAAEKGI